MQAVQTDPRTSSYGVPGRGKAFRIAALTILTIGVLLGAATEGGGIVVVEIQNILDFYAGVVSLVTLTGAVVFGLITTERITSPPVRVLIQAVHRSSAVVAVGFLVAHVVLEILAQKATLVDALVPFLEQSDNALFIGLGTISAHLMVLAYAVGIIRRRFVASTRPWVWRILHSAAYVSWPVALAHGLTAGRFAAVWVQWSWAVCGLLIGIGALTRLMVTIRFANSKIASARPGVERKLRRSDARYARVRTEQARAESYRSRPPAGPPPGRPEMPMPRSGGMPPPQRMPRQPRPPARPGPQRGRPARGGRPANLIPDEDFWSNLRSEVGPLSGGRG